MFRIKGYLLSFAVVICFVIQFPVDRAQASSNTNGGVGHGLGINLIEEGSVPDHLIDDLALEINGNYSKRRKVLKTHDFTGDGVPDYVVCHIMSNTDNGVEIFDGKTNALYFSWQVPDYNKGGVNRQFRNCSIAEVAPGKPAIFYAGARAGSSGIRYNEYQWFHYKNNNGGMSLGMVKQPDGSANYVGAMRSVNCTNYPKKLVDIGYKPGALCFYAAYDSNLAIGYGTATALVKIEYTNNTLVYKDLTNSSGMLWAGGMKGTSMNHGNITWTNGLSNNLSMMDGAFIDFNRDGYTDILTGGAHSDMYEWKMVTDGSKAEGFRFAKKKLEYSYIWRLQALNETEPKLDSTCVFVGDSTYRGSPGRQNYLKCYKNGQWVRADFPSASVHGGETSVNVLTDGDGKIYIHLSQPEAPAGPRFYTINFRDDVMSHSLGISYKSDRLVVVGYVCRKNSKDEPITLALTSKKTSGESGYKVYKRMGDVDLKLNQNQRPNCLAKEAAPGKIKYEVLKKDLISSKGTIWVRINHPNLQNIVKGINYQY